MKRVTRRTIAIVFGVVLLTSAPPTFAQAVDAIDQWNAIAVNEAVVVAKKFQTASLIDVTIVQIAVYDAVNAVSGGKFRSYAGVPPANPLGSIDAAAAQAAHDVLVWLYPARQANLDQLLATTLTAVPDGTAKADGIETGAAAAAAIIALRANDGRNANITYAGGTAPGQWRPTPPAFAPAQTPWVAFMAPFTMTSAAQFRPDGPPALSSDEWAEAFNEVKTRGAAVGSTRTDEETETALFFNDNGVAQFNRYYRRLAAARELSQMDKARMYVMANVAGADSLIACFDGKYTYGFWRPVTAIPLADTDDNANTVADPSWTSLLVTPNHPEYPSAHGCYTSGVTTALASFFGTDKVTSTMDSAVPGSGPDGTTGVRTYDRFSDLFADVFRARILGGIHYRFSLDDGGEVGRHVAKQMVRNYFDPVRREHARRATAAVRGGVGR